MLRSKSLALVAIVAMGVANPAKAVVIDYELDTPGPGVNELTVNLGLGGMVIDSLSTTVTGNIMADLVGISGTDLDGTIEFVDVVSTILLTDLVNAPIDLQILGTGTATLSSAAFRIESVGGAGTVTAGAFDLMGFPTAQNIVLDQGSATIVGTTGTLFSLAPPPTGLVLDFATDPLAEDVTALGFAIPGVLGTNGDTIVVDIDVILPVELLPGVFLEVGLVGSLQGTVVPEPSTYALVGVGMLVGGLTYRRRRSQKVAA